MKSKEKPAVFQRTMHVVENVHHELSHPQRYTRLVRQTARQASGKYWMPKLSEQLFGIETKKIAKKLLIIKCKKKRSTMKYIYQSLANEQMTQKCQIFLYAKFQKRNLFRTK